MTMTNLISLIVSFLENKTENVLYNVPANETSEQSGNCGNDTNDQQIVVKWGPQYTQSNFLLLFSLNKSTNVFALKEFVINLNTNELPKGKNESLVFYHSGNIFNAPRDMSYHCTKVQYLNLAYDEKSNKSVASARLSHVQLEAYHKTHDNKFSVAKDCDAIDTPGNDNNSINRSTTNKQNISNFYFILQILYPLPSVVH